MKIFSVGTNFADDLLPAIAEMDVYEVYGKLASDAVGGARSSAILKNINFSRLALEVKNAHSRGIEFNYLLNATCLENLEYSISGQKQIRDLLGSLEEIGVDSVTVAIPFLAIFIKRNFPKFKIDVSVLCQVNSLTKISAWQDLGVNVITLDIALNRNFSALEEIVKRKKVEYKLMLNQGCEGECIHWNYHANIAAHQSRADDFFLENCLFHCRLERIKNLDIFLRAPWIRPEDLGIYEKLGFSKFKIVQRHDPSEKIIRTLTAYRERKYKGNFLDIANLLVGQPRSHPKMLEERTLRNVKALLKPSRVNIMRLYELSKLVDDDFDLVIDNEKLDGFLEGFYLRNCGKCDCSECDYCKSWVERVITFNAEKRESVMANYEKICSLFHDREHSLF